MNIRKWNKGVQRKIYKNWNEIQGILLRKYPDFIFSDRVNDVIDIPAFVFHDVTNESLEPILRFLAINQYATLTADEYYERSSKREKGQEREVLLTFDDGDKSLYTVAYPALKRYGFRAVAYIVPGMTPQGDGTGDSKVWEGSVCNWNEIREMHESGTVDIQSHSMYHHSISISSRVIDFVRPGMDLSSWETDLLPLTQAGVRDSHDLPFGTPIYDWGPRLGEARGFRGHPSVAMACVEHVDRHGGAEYFRTRWWRRELQRLTAAARRGQPGTAFETEAEQRSAILDDFTNSKAQIERRLPDTSVRHFCYPWFRGSVLAATLSAEAGYVSNAWGSVLPRFATSKLVPMPFARFSPAYLWRLPGRGRKPIGAVIRGRLSPIAEDGSE